MKQSNDAGQKRILICGIGNPGREDDGLGFFFVSRLETIGFTRTDQQIDLRHVYQLNIEDAELICHYDLVIFVDACKNLEGSFQWQQIEGEKQSDFSTHALTIPSVLALASEFFDSVPVCYLLSIGGFTFRIKEGLSEKTEKHLSQALEWFASERLPIES